MYSSIFGMQPSQNIMGVITSKRMRWGGEKYVKKIVVGKPVFIRPHGTPRQAYVYV